MGKAPSSKFILRTNREVGKYDVVLGILTLGDKHTALYRNWCEWGPDCNVYRLSDGTLLARGKALDKAEAVGFFAGWKRRGQFEE